MKNIIYLFILLILLIIIDKNNKIDKFSISCQPDDCNDFSNQMDITNNFIYLEGGCEDLQPDEPTDCGEYYSFIYNQGPLGTYVKCKNQILEQKFGNESRILGDMCVKSNCMHELSFYDIIRGSSGLIIIFTTGVALFFIFCIQVTPRSVCSAIFKSFNDVEEPLLPPRPSGVMQDAVNQESFLSARSTFAQSWSSVVSDYHSDDEYGTTRILSDMTIVPISDQYNPTHDELQEISDYWIHNLLETQAINRQNLPGQLTAIEADNVVQLPHDSDWLSPPIEIVRVVPIEYSDNTPTDIPDNRNTRILTEVEDVDVIFKTYEFNIDKNITLDNLIYGLYNISINMSSPGISNLYQIQ